MEPTHSNAMIFGGIGNLRLAPHVREGRSVNAVSAPRPAEGTAAAGSGLPVERPATPATPRGRGFQAGEKVTISAAARDALAATVGPGASASDDVAPGVAPSGSVAEMNAPVAERASSAPNALTEEEQREVDELKARDAEVRAHEQAHKAAGGSLVTSGPTYEYTRGPDGNRYATGGEVGIDVSEVPDDPEATVRKAQRIRAAALAPAEPSGQDRAVAAQAAAMAAEAQAEIAQQRRDEVQGADSTAPGASPSAEPAASPAGAAAASGLIPSDVASAYAAASGRVPATNGPFGSAPTNGLFA